MELEIQEDQEEVEEIQEQVDQVTHHQLVLLKEIMEE